MRTDVVCKWLGYLCVLRNKIKPYNINIVNNIMNEINNIWNKVVDASPYNIFSRSRESPRIIGQNANDARRDSETFSFRNLLDCVTYSYINDTYNIMHHANRRAHRLQFVIIVFFITRVNVFKKQLCQFGGDLLTKRVFRYEYNTRKILFST